MNLDELGSFGILYLILFFIFYNVASIVGSVKNNSEINQLDVIVVGTLPIIFLLSLNEILDIELELFGIIVMLLSLVYLFIVYLLKNNNTS
jgi:uncharacterized membrane protein HdeD (DUF308 family)